MKLNLFRGRKKTTPVKHPTVRIQINETRLSAANAEQIKQVLQPQLVGQCSAVLQLDQLKFIDSSGLGCLVALRNQMLSPKMVILEGISDPTLIDLFRLTRMDQVFLISEHPTQTERLLGLHLTVE